MNRTVSWIGVGVVFVLCLGAVGAWAQQQAVAAEPQAPSRTAQAPPELAPTLPVPRLVKFSGVVKDELGKPRTGTVGITFAIYKEQEGGAALWLETQNVELDEQGHYTVLLGATKPEGLPLELFTSGEPRWLGVQVNLPKELEQPRVLLVSVPYALKAADADTVGGMPASAFVLAAPSSTVSGTSVSGSTTPASGNSKTLGKTAASGKTAAAAAPVAANFIPVFLDNAGTLGSSVMSQSGSFIGVGTTSPAAALHVNGDTLLVTSGTTAQVQFSGALSSARFGQDGSGAFFASDTPGKAVRFYTNNGTLNEGLRITSDSNVGIGTQTPAAKLDVVGNFNLPNTTSGGTAGVIQLGGARFAHNFGTNNTFLGANAGNTSLTGTNNTGVGTGALFANTTGSDNTAVGSGALQANLASSNTAVGSSALQANTTGASNSAFGLGALASNTTGTSNSAFGRFALVNNTTGTGNSAFGTNTLNSNTASSNSAFGVSALTSNTTGGANSAFGSAALFSNTTGNNNAAFGTSALSSNTGGGNTAVGASALQANTTGGNNTAVGLNALASNTTASGNTAMGQSALSANTTGFGNTAVGSSALLGNTANFNTAVGSSALQANTTGGANDAFGGSALLRNTTGNFNDAFGDGALQNLTGGSGNIAIGGGAGSNLTTGSSNIYIANGGATTESSTIRIGSVGTQTAAFIAGISGVNVSGTAVLVSSSGQLGVAVSSRRFKEQIADLGGESDLLMKLRPVAFYYKPEYDDTHTRQYGLVAEEVAQVAPQLVVFDKDGAPQTVRYHFVNAMLLNEVQKQRRLVEEQQRENEEQRTTIARQESKIQDLEARLAKLEAAIAGR